MNKETVIYNYTHHLWPLQLVKIAVKKGILTKEEYKELTGKEYK